MASQTGVTRWEEGKQSRVKLITCPFRVIAAITLALAVLYYGSLFIRMNSTHVMLAAVAVSARNATLPVAGLSSVVRSGAVPHDVTKAASREAQTKLTRPDTILNATIASLTEWHVSVNKTTTPAPPSVLQIQVFSPMGINHYAHYKIGRDGLPMKTVQCMNNKSNASLTIELVLSNDVRRLTSSSSAVNAVLFNFVEEGSLTRRVPELANVSGKIEAMNRTQLWIFRARESASYMRWIQGGVKNLPIHILSSYHPLAEIPYMWGYYRRGQPMQGYGDPSTTAISLANLMHKKTSLAVWVAQNCHNTFWPRLEFVKSLQSHINVDVYGGCGTLSCTPRMSTKCLVVFEKYKFFLALENSECDYYVTEKIWNTLTHDIVPVVYGPRRVDYERVAPPNSFIHVADFNSTKELAQYLVHLDKNPEEYFKYFEWRTQGTVTRWQPPAADRWCGLPEILRRVEQGKLKKRLLSKTRFFNSCRPQKGSEEFRTGRPKLADWKPRK